ncbi:anaerobic sulfatase maturase [Faecalicatena orotica]|mgnify:CR=1 FL=1|nr:anaerobic sulfatase maturase [Faecalicatena orotica]SCH61126.1 Anaerobic sulfatase-maturating enzyme [uncultured Clostridium sp.]
MPPISVLIKPASGICNMKCDYCFYCDEAKKRITKSYGFMTERTLRNVIRKTMLHADGMISYVFQGGEPTLRGLEFFEKVIEYQKQYNKNRVYVNNAIQTNGYALNEEWAKFFKENHFLVGFSLDGTKENHDLYRHNTEGEGTYDRILKSINLMDAYGVDYNILTVVTKDTAEHISEIYKEYQTRGWNYQQYIACLDPLGEERGKNPYALTPVQYGSFLIELFQLWYEDWKKKKQPYIRQFDNYIGILMGYQPESCDQRGSCGVQTVVEADGSVYPCDFYMLDEYYLGNLNEHRIEDIERMRKEIGFIERSEKVSEECRKCQYYRICRGGCQRNRERNSYSGEYENYFCSGYKMFFDACLEQLKEIAREVNFRKSVR